MKASMWALLASTTAFAASSIYLWNALDEEQARAAQLEQTSREIGARLVDLEKSRRTLAAQSIEPFASASSGSWSSGKQPPPPPQTGPAVGLQVQASGGAQIMVRPSRMSEAQRRMLRNQMRGQNRRLYFDVHEALDLDDDQAAKLLDLVTDQQTAGIQAEHRPNSPAELESLLAEQRRKQDAQIAEIIGVGKLPALKEYLATMPARSELDQAARVLEDAAAPLTVEQRKRVLAVILAERERLPEPPVAEAGASAQYTAAYANWQKEYSARLTAAVVPFLNSQQSELYRDHLQLQEQMREEFARSIAALEAQGQGASNGQFYQAVVVGEEPDTAGAGGVVDARP